MTCRRLAPPLIAVLAVLDAGCRDQEPPTAGQEQSMWITEPEFRFGNTPEGVYFTLPLVRVDPGRNRVLALDGMEVSAWYIPPVEGKPVLSASGEVWLLSTETADTFSVYYAVGRGTTNEPPRRVLLPEGMYVSDATSTLIATVRGSLGGHAAERMGPPGIAVPAVTGTKAAGAPPARGARPGP